MTPDEFISIMTTALASTPPDEVATSAPAQRLSGRDILCFSHDWTGDPLSKTHFMRLLYEAECVFYWNLFSASIVARALSRLPLFLFDRGHLGAVVKAFHEAARRQVYPGCVIKLLDPESRLTIAALAPLAESLPSALYDPLHANLSRAASPEEVVRKLVS